MIYFSIAIMCDEEERKVSSNHLNATGLLTSSIRLAMKRYVRPNKTPRRRSNQDFGTVASSVV